MNDREKAGLRGSVVVCETEQRRFNPFSNDASVTRESFHRDGRRIELKQSGRFTWSQRWLYDADDRPREEVFDGVFGYRKIFVYDVKGRLEQMRVRDRDGERLEEYWSYYDDGSSLHTLFPRLPDLGGAGIVASDAMLQMSLDAVRIMTMQDVRGHPLEKVFYNADNRPIQRVLYQYDAAGRLMEEGEAYSDNRIRDDFRNLFRYDAHGRCVTREIYRPFRSERYTTAYNECGDVSETRIAPLLTDSSPALDCFSQDSWTSNFRYAYDASGNWLTCHAETRASSTGEISHREEKNRKVEYP